MANIGTFNDADLAVVVTALDGYTKMINFQMVKAQSRGDNPLAKNYSGTLPLIVTARAIAISLLGTTTNISGTAVGSYGTDYNDSYPWTIDNSL
jgi:hypothetical protein